MGDLEFIQDKVLTGDYFRVKGDINALNDTIEFVVPNGRTAFLIEAHVVITSEPEFIEVGSETVTGTPNKITAQLLVDNVEEDRVRPGNTGVAARGAGTSVSGGGGVGGDSDGDFKTLGVSLVGDGAKKIEIKNLLDNGSAFALMSGYLV